ncbi:hypothetical protein RvY_13614-1 [Ramazzottius varieornatus]|uniref:Uncharacterized protein n=1 Tax=Ramazzottius varieornatus TaxID=947166 RepID=A0A1D1VQA4_RAMVA|nr:hypothetical protein RvY_13614-1 [Ramazzottius varieornatus]
MRQSRRLEGGSLLLFSVTCFQALRISTTFAVATAGQSNVFSTNDYHSRFKRATSTADSSFPYPLVKSSGLTSESRAEVPFEVSSTGVSRTLYPFYKTNAVLPISSSALSYTVPVGAIPLIAGRSSPSTGNSAVNSAYNPSYSNDYGSVSPVNTYNPSTYAQPSQRSFSPYASYPSYSNNYPTNSYPSNSYPNNYNNYYPSNTYSPNINPYYPTNSYGTNSYTVPSPVRPAGNYALSFRSADPLEPEEPGSDSSSKMVQAAPLLSRSIPSPVASSIPSNVGFSGSAQQFAAQSLAASTGVSSDAVAAGGLGGSSGAGIGTGYAAATPDGASYVGPGSPGFAQSSPNTASGTLYNPKYGSSPRFYGAATPTGVAASPALLYPYFLYYPVQYGYDQGEQSVMPNGGFFPLIGYKRRYGYRNGPYYGYGIYVDYPPYFGFGKVKDGFGYDPEADLMASVALEQGSGTSEGLSINAAGSANQGYAQSGNPGNYGAPTQGGYGGQSPATAYGNTGQGYAANPSPYISQTTGYSPSQSQYGASNYGQVSPQNTYAGRSISSSSATSASSPTSFPSAASFPGLTKYAPANSPVALASAQG